MVKTVETRYCTHILFYCHRMKITKALYPTLIFLLAVTIVSAQEMQEKKAHGMDEIAIAEQRAYEHKQEAATLRTASVASSNFDVYFYRCEWEVDPAIRYIKGKITAYFTITAAANSITFDLHKDLAADSILYKNIKLNFRQLNDHSLTIQLPQTLAANEKDSLSVYYQGIPVNDGFGSFSTSTQNNIPVMWTLSEPYGAKDWWPCKNSQADKADSIDIMLTYPAVYNSSSNGVLVEEKVTNGRKTSTWKHRYPISSYLVAFAVTNYETQNDSVIIANKVVPVRLRVYGNAGYYFMHAIPLAKNCLLKYSSLFGPYPFLKEGYSQTQFGWGGGMEHQTNSFINSEYDQLVAHELSHQWFGDRVTCRSWTDIWLNEGFAQYMQFIYLQNFDTALVMPYLNATRTKVTAQPGGSVKVPDTSNASRIFDARLSYLKGSCGLHMIRWKLGDALFFKALQQYLNDPLIAYKNATTADLQRNLESISGQSFRDFFKNWYEGEGYPSYQVQWSENKNNQVKIRLGQTTSHPSVSFYAMPVPLQLKGAGRDTIITLNHTRNGAEFWINAGFLVDTVIFDPKVWLLSGTNAVTKIAASSMTNEIKIYPNPAAQYVNVSIANPGSRRVVLQLYNTLSQSVYEKSLELTGADLVIPIPVSFLPVGVYWLKITGDDGLKMVRTVVK